MKGSYLNGKRFTFLQSMESLLEEVKQAVTIAKADYHRFDEYDEYRTNYAKEYIGKMAEAELALMKVMEVVNE